jgi:hypothetical protein
MSFVQQIREKIRGSSPVSQPAGRRSVERHCGLHPKSHFFLEHMSGIHKDVTRTVIDLK